jgi:hypothetical protein
MRFLDEAAVDLTGAKCCRCTFLGLPAVSRSELFSYSAANALAQLKS